MNIWGLALRLAGWSVDITAPRRDKCVICVAPHTSNLDFLAGLAAYRSLGRKANFLMKDFWFFFPLKYLLRALGGIPVVRSKVRRESLTKTVAEMFRTRPYINLAITPEGTRSLRSEWHTGFLHIAYDAGVPVQLGVIDYRRKVVEIRYEYRPTGDIEADMRHVKEFYSHYSDAARYADKFTV